MKVIFTIISLLLLQACSTLGPVDTPQYMPMISKASNVSEKEVILSSRASWMNFNVDHCWTNEAYMINCTKEQINNGFSSQLLKGKKPNDSILVLSENSVPFLDWDSNRRQYINNTTLPVNDITTLERHQFGLSRLIRIGMNNTTKRYYIFTLMNDSAQMQDSKKADKLFSHLRQKSAANGVQPVEF